MIITRWVHFSSVLCRYWCEIQHPCTSTNDEKYCCRVCKRLDVHQTILKHISKSFTHRPPQRIINGISAIVHSLLRAYSLHIFTLIKRHHQTILRCQPRIKIQKHRQKQPMYQPLRNSQKHKHNTQTPDSKQRYQQCGRTFFELIYFTKTCKVFTSSTYLREPLVVIFTLMPPV